MNSHPRISAWFVGGCAAASGTLGLLVGASQSPVAGTFVTAVFGLAVGAFGVYDQRRAVSLLEEARNALDAESAELRSKAGRKLDSELAGVFRLDSSRVGKILLVFAVSFVIGLIGGAQVRASGWPRVAQSSRDFPWEEATAPTIPFNALDWIAIQENLLDIGYSSKEVKDLYEIQAKIWKKEGERIPSTGLVGSHEPLSQLLTGGPSRTRGEKGKDETGGLVVLGESKPGKPKG